MVYLGLLWGIIPAKQPRPQETSQKLRPCLWKQHVMVLIGGVDLVDWPVTNSLTKIYSHEMSRGERTNITWLRLVKLVVKICQDPFPLLWYIIAAWLRLRQRGKPAASPPAAVGHSDHWNPMVWERSGAICTTSYTDLKKNIGTGMFRRKIWPSTQG